MFGKDDAGVALIIIHPSSLLKGPRGSINTLVRRNKHLWTDFNNHKRFLMLGPSEIDWRNNLGKAGYVQREYPNGKDKIGWLKKIYEEARKEKAIVGYEPNRDIKIAAEEFVHELKHKEMVTDVVISGGFIGTLPDLQGNEPCVVAALRDLFSPNFTCWLVLEDLSWWGESITGMGKAEERFKKVNERFPKIGDVKVLPTGRIQAKEFYEKCLASRGKGAK